MQQNNTQLSALGIMIPGVVVLTLVFATGGEERSVISNIITLLIGTELLGLIFKTSLLMIVFSLYNLLTITKSDKLDNKTPRQISLTALQTHGIAILISILVGLYYYFYQKGDGWEIIIAPLLAFFTYLSLLALAIVGNFVHRKWSIRHQKFIYAIAVLVMLIIFYFFITEVILIDWLGINVYEYL